MVEIEGLPSDFWRSMQSRFLPAGWAVFLLALFAGLMPIAASAESCLEITDNVNYQASVTAQSSAKLLNGIATLSKAKLKIDKTSKAVAKKFLKASALKVELLRQGNNLKTARCLDGVTFCEIGLEEIQSKNLTLAKKQKIASKKIKNIVSKLPKKDAKKAKAQIKKLEATRSLWKSDSSSLYNLEKLKIAKCSQAEGTTPTPIPTSDPAPTSSSEPTPMITATPQPSVTPTTTPTATITPSPTTTATPTPSPSATSTPTPGSTSTPTPTNSPTATPTPTATPVVQTIKVFSWMTGSSLVIPNTYTSFNALESAIVAGFSFENTGTSSEYIFFRVFTNQHYLADFYYPVTQNLDITIDQLVNEAKDFKLEPGAIAIPIIPHMDGKSTEWVVADKKNSDELAEVNTFKQLFEQNHSLLLSEGAPSTVSTLLLRSGETSSDVGTYSSAKVIEKGKNIRILPHEFFNLEESTFNIGSLEYNFVEKYKTKKGALVRFRGAYPLDPARIEYTFKNDPSRTLVLRPRLVLVNDGTKANLVKDNLESKLDLSDLVDELQRILIYYANRDYDLSVELKSGNKYVVSGQGYYPGDQIQVKGDLDKDEGIFYHPGYIFEKIGGGTYNLFYVNNKYLYLLAGLIIDYYDFYDSTISAKLGGSLGLSHGGFLELVEQGQTSRFYAGGYIVAPDGTLILSDIDAKEPVTFSPGTVTYERIMDFVDDNFRIAVTEFLSGGGYKLFASSDGDNYVYEIKIFADQNKAPKIDKYDPVVLEYLQYQMLSNILWMQHMTAMTIINNIAPIPVYW